MRRCWPGWPLRAPETMVCIAPVLAANERAMARAGVHRATGLHPFRRC